MTNAQLLQLLGAVLVLTAFWMLVARRLDDYLHAYILQSIAVAGVALVVGISIHSVDLYLVAFFTVLVKVILISAILRVTSSRIGTHHDVRSALNRPISLLFGVGLVLLAFLTSPSVVAPGTFLDEPPLAISVGVVLIGLFIITIRRHVIAQVVGLLTIENGLFSGAIAIAYGMPLIVEFGILFDVLIAVVLLGLLISLIQHHVLTADTGELRNLRG